VGDGLAVGRVWTVPSPPGEENSRGDYFLVPAEVAGFVPVEPPLDAAFEDPEDPESDPEPLEAPEPEDGVAALSFEDDPSLEESAEDEESPPEDSEDPVPPDPPLDARESLR